MPVTVSMEALVPSLLTITGTSFMSARFHTAWGMLGLDDEN